MHHTFYLSIHLLMGTWAESIPYLLPVNILGHIQVSVSIDFPVLSNAHIGLQPYHLEAYLLNESLVMEK